MLLMKLGKLFKRLSLALFNALANYELLFFLPLILAILLFDLLFIPLLIW